MYTSCTYSLKQFSCRNKFWVKGRVTIFFRKPRMRRGQHYIIHNILEKLAFGYVALTFWEKVPSSYMPLS